MNEREELEVGKEYWCFMGDDFEVVTITGKMIGPVSGVVMYQISGGSWHNANFFRA